MKIPAPESRDRISLPAVILESKFGEECFFYCDELSSRHPVRWRLSTPWDSLPLETRDTDHEKFVKVVCKDGKELHPFKERVPLVLCFLQHMVVETNPLDSRLI